MYVVMSDCGLELLQISNWWMLCMSIRLKESAFKLLGWYNVVQSYKGT